MFFIDYRSADVPWRAGLFARVTEGIEYSIRRLGNGIRCVYRGLGVCKDVKGLLYKFSSFLHLPLVRLVE